MKSRIAIIIVNFNGWKDTIECIHSIEEVSYKSFEVIVVDNASSDESVDKLKALISETPVAITLIEEKENRGFSAGNNVGILYAMKRNFDYYLMLNNDTLVDKEFLDELLKPFELDEVGASIGQIYYAYNMKKIWYAGGALNSKYIKPIHLKYNQTEIEHVSEIKEVTFATGCCICCSKELLDKIGLWNETFFLYEEDVDFSIRIMNAGYRIIYNSDAIVYHKVSASTGIIAGNAEYYQIRNRLLLINMYKTGFGVLWAKIYTFLFCINRIIKREYQIKPMIDAYRDYLKKRTGKREL